MLLLLFAFASFASAQNMNVAESAKQPGDPLRYTITLDAPVKGAVTTIILSFSLVTDVQKGQEGLQQDFSLMAFKQISSVQYQVEGVTPASMSGTYQLKQIQFRTSGGIRNYEFPTDFKQEVKLKIETPEKDVFPKIKSVEPTR
jgi:hypothetical protein